MLQGIGGFCGPCLGVLKRTFLSCLTPDFAKWPDKGPVQFSSCTSALKRSYASDIRSHTRQLLPERASASGSQLLLIVETHLDFGHRIIARVGRASKTCLLTS